MYIYTVAMKTRRQKEIIKTARKNFLKRIPWAAVVTSSLIFGPVVWFLAWFITSAVHNSNKPEHLVQVEYVVYDVPGGSTYIGNYKLKGESFTVVKTSSNGTNTLRIKDKDDSGVSVKGQYATVYTGTSDVREKSMRIVK